MTKISFNTPDKETIWAIGSLLYLWILFIYIFGLVLNNFILGFGLSSGMIFALITIITEITKEYK